MPGYTLKINSFVFAVTPEVFPQLDYNWKRDGSQISVKETWPLRCWFVRDSVADIRSDWNAFLALIETGAPQNVQFLFNGAPVDDLLTSINNNTPRFENIHVVNQGGGFVNHIEFTMDVVAEKPIKFSKIIDVDESVEEITGFNGSSTRVRISAVGNNAREFVLDRLASKNRGIPTNLVKKTQEFDNYFEVTADFDTIQQSAGGSSRPAQDRALRIVNERYDVEAGLRPIREYGISTDRDIPPYLVSGAFRGIRVRSTGHIEVVDLDQNGRVPDYFFLFPTVGGGAVRALAPFIDAHSVSSPYVSEWSDIATPYVWAMDWSWSAILPETSRIRPRIKAGVDPAKHLEFAPRLESRFR